MWKWSRLRWILLLAVIVAGHVAMWLSPNTTTEQALRLTLTNAAIWSVVLLPALGVGMWARTHRRLSARSGQAAGDARDPGTRSAESPQGRGAQPAGRAPR